MVQDGTKRLSNGLRKKDPSGGIAKGNAQPWILTLRNESWNAVNYMFKLRILRPMSWHSFTPSLGPDYQSSATSAQTPASASSPLWYSYI